MVIKILIGFSFLFCVIKFDVNAKSHDNSSTDADENVISKESVTDKKANESKVIKSRQMMPTAVINKGPIMTSLASLLAVKYWQTKRYRQCCASGRCACGGGAGGGLGPGMGGGGMGPGLSSPGIGPEIGGATGETNYDTDGLTDQVNSFRPNNIQVQTRPTRPRPVRVRPFQRPQTPAPTPPTLFVSAWDPNRGGGQGSQSGSSQWQNGQSNRWPSNRPIQFQSDETDAFPESNFEHISGGSFGLSGRRRPQTRPLPNRVDAGGGKRRKRSIKNCVRGQLSSSSSPPKEIEEPLPVLAPPTRASTAPYERSRTKRSPGKRRNRRKNILKNERKNKNGGENGGQRKERPTRRPPNPQAEKPVRTRRPVTSGETNGRKIRRKT